MESMQTADSEYREDAGVTVISGLDGLEAAGLPQLRCRPAVVVCSSEDVHTVATCGRRRRSMLRRVFRLPRIIVTASAADVPLLKTALGWDGVLPEVLPQIVLAAPSGDLSEICQQARCIPPLSALGLMRALEAGQMPELGHGSRRICRKVAGLPYCVKFYRQPDDLPEGASHELLRELSLERDDERRNTSCEEYAYFRKTVAACPASLRAVFPDCVEKIYLPGHGWGILETLVTHADGSPVMPMVAWLRSPACSGVRKEETVACLSQLYRDFYRCAIRFFDVQNLVVQLDADGHVRIRLTDFEPRSRTLIPVDRLCRQLVRNKFRRRFLRFFNYFRDVLPPSFYEGLRG